MKYYLFNINAESLEYTSLEKLSEYLDENYKHWLGGNGASSIEVKQDESLIFFKTNEGYTILHHPSYKAPLVDTVKEIPDYKSHYIGGEEFQYPDVCVCDKATALNIFEEYITNEELSTDFDWVGIYSFENAPEF